MKDTWGLTRIGLLMTLSAVLLLAISLAVAAAFEGLQCQSRWEAAGFNSTYGPLKGCMVQTKDGRWLPEKTIRDVDLTRPRT